MKDFLKSILVLGVLCLIISAALAVTNSKTAVIIEAAAAEKAEQARQAVLPEADSFTKLDISNLPPTVTESYKADNGAGYVFMMATKGYGGQIKLICGIDADDKITSCMTLSHSETQGLGSKITEAGFEELFSGKDETLEGVDTISGATISSASYINAVKEAFEALSLVKEAE